MAAERAVQGVANGAGRRQGQRTRRWGLADVSLGRSLRRRAAADGGGGRGPEEMRTGAGQAGRAAKVLVNDGPGVDGSYQGTG